MRVEYFFFYVFETCINTSQMVIAVLGLYILPYDDVGVQRWCLALSIWSKHVVNDKIMIGWSENVACMRTGRYAHKAFVGYLKKKENI
jgi:hypothetical protein